MDLENYEPETDDPILDRRFIDDLVPTRDAARRLSNRISLINLIIFAFLATDYFSVGLSFTIPGVSIIDKKGVREFLILYASLTGLYCLMIQNNIYILDSVIKFIIGTKIPLELRGIFTAKYFYHENFPSLMPVNLPHISFSRWNTNVAIYTSIIVLVMMALYYCAYLFMYTIIAIDVWKAAKLGYWSYAIAGASIVNTIVGALYMAFTRMRMPYRDYTALHELNGLPQIAPSQFEKRRNEIYGEGTRDWQDLRKRGYIKTTDQ